MDWDPTMQVVPWVGFQSKMKSPNSKIKETGRRKGRNKKNEGFRVKMDFYFYFLFLKMKNKLKFFSYFVEKLQQK